MTLLVSEVFYLLIPREYFHQCLGNLWLQGRLGMQVGNFDVLCILEKELIYSFFIKSCHHNLKQNLLSTEKVNKKENERKKPDFRELSLFCELFLYPNKKWMGVHVCICKDGAGIYIFPKTGLVYMYINPVFRKMAASVHSYIVTDFFFQSLNNYSLQLF